MTLPILQIVLGIGIGLLGFLLLRPALQDHPNREHREQRRRRQGSQYDYQRTYDEDDGRAFKSKPGDICAICCDPITETQMQYIACGHALHINCYQECVKFQDTCPLCRKKM